MQRFDDESGQATAEYVALVALVGVVLALAAGLTSGGIASHALAGIQRGLCRVAATACPRPVAPRVDLAPCPVERLERKEQATAMLGVLRFGDSGTLTAIRLSDGRVTVMLADGGSAGGELGSGFRLRLGDASLGGGLRTALHSTWTSGRAWTLPSQQAARRFVASFGAKVTIGGKLVDTIRSHCSLLCDAIGWRPHPRLPAPDEVFREAGSKGSLTASLGVGSGEVPDTHVLGWRIRRDGAKTAFLRLEAGAKAQLADGLLAIGGGVAHQTILSYTIDPRGQPAELTIRSVGERSGRLGLAAGGSARRAKADMGGGVAVDLQATLDLHDAASRAVSTRAVRALVHGATPAALGARLRALRDRLADRAQLDRRVYALESTTTGAGGTVAFGVALGADVERTTKGLRLVSAETRLPGLPFLPRDDCRPA